MSNYNLMAMKVLRKIKVGKVSLITIEKLANLMRDEIENNKPIKEWQLALILENVVCEK